MNDHSKLDVKWATCPRPQNNAKSRLFCFAYAGAGANVFAAWPMRLAPEIEVWYIHLPGRERRIKETPLTDFPKVVEAITEELIPLCGREFSFFGHSLGGLISFEVARRIRQQAGVVPDHLIVSATRAPRVAWPFPSTRRLTDAEFISEIQQRYQGIPEQILLEPELLAFLLPALRADVELLESYQYFESKPLESRIKVLGGSDDAMVGKDALLPWQKETSEKFELRMFPGNHFFIQQQLADVLRLVAITLQGEVISCSRD